MTALEIQWKLLRPGPRLRRVARPRGGRRGGRRAGARPMGVGPRRSRVGSDDPRRPTRLGRQVPAVRRATASATASSGATPASPPWTSSTTTCGPASSLARRVGLVRLTDDDEVLRAVSEPPLDDPGVLPWHVPRTVRRRHRRRQLGLDRVRRRRGVPAAGPDARARSWDRGARGRSARRRRPRARTCWRGSAAEASRRRSTDAAARLRTVQHGGDVGHRRAIGICARFSGTPRYGGRDAEVVHART